MQVKTFVVIILVAAALVGGLLAFHGSGHRILVKWLPAIHGERR